MRAAGISGLVRRKRGRTTIRVPGVRVADDLVERQFRPGAPNVLWIADVTYLRTWEGWLYLAAVQDAYSPPDRRLEHGRSHALRARRRRARDGRQPPAPGARADPPLRPGLARRIPAVVATLDHEELRWASTSERRIEPGDRRCDRRDGRRSGGASIVQRFWAAIARGERSDAAGVEAGVSPVVGVRWFREAGGMPPIGQAPLSGRYLSFAEREEIAVLRAGGCGVREVARRLGRSPSTISRELRRNAATRSGRFDVSRDNGAVACRSARQAPQAGEAGAQHSPARLRAGSARRPRATSRRCRGRWARGRVDRPAPRSPPGPALGAVVEPGADLQPAAPGLPR